MLKKFLGALAVPFCLLLGAGDSLAAATKLVVLPNPTATVGVATSFQVQAVDGSNNTIDTTYSGTVGFGSSDDYALLPSSATLVGGIATVSMTFQSAGSHTITAFSWSVNPFLTGMSTNVTVSGGAATSLSVSAPATASSNVPINVTVTAKDAYGNNANTYTGTVTITSSDGAAVLPPFAALVAGAGTFPVTLKTVGNQTVTAKDAATPSITGTSGAIAVSETPVLGFNPTSLAFGGQSMKTTAPTKTVTISNTGGGAATISSITATTTTVAASFGVTHNCGSTLNAGANCTATVSFTPSVEGSITGNLAIATSAGTTNVALTGAGEKSLVTHYYLSILRRAPDDAGKAFWNAEAARLQALGPNVNEVWFAMAQSFYFSSEYASFGRTDTDFVTDLYRTFFNRAPDTDGLNGWLSQLSQGMPREVVLTSFMFSAEFAQFTQGIFGNVAVRPELDMVTDFFRGLLARLPDDSGFNFWLGKFRTAQCIGPGAVLTEAESISSQFALSTEYTGKNRTNAQYVGDLYNAFLRRGGDLTGVLFWIGKLQDGSLSREQLRQTFLESEEFVARRNAVALAGAAPGVTCDIAGVDYDINGFLIPTTPTGEGNTAQGYPVVCNNGQNPGPGTGPCGAYKIAVGNCSAGMSGGNAITDAYLWNLENLQPGSIRLGNSIRYALARNAAIVWKFKTGPTGAFPAFPYPLQMGWDELVSRGPNVSPFISLSTTKCDFDYAKLDEPANSCYQSGEPKGALLGRIYTTDQNPATTFPYCPLRPDTTYYLNIRWENAVQNRGTLSCPPESPQCAMTLGIN